MANKGSKITTIRLKAETRDKLKAIRNKGESCDEIINRLLAYYGEIEKVDIFPFSDTLVSHLGASNQGKYLFDYLKDLGAKKCVLEKEYIDKDYIIDYQKFYSRSFATIGKFTTRIHFFTEDFAVGDLKNSLENNDTEYMEHLNEIYLGFVVVRPIKDEKGEPFVGRTLLNTYPSEGGKRSFIVKKYDASLFGIPLTVESIPFQAQDQGVSACATIALWSALHPLADTFGIIRHSPAEITEVSTSLPTLARKYPSGGLAWEQMINYIRTLGLDVETIDALHVDEDTIQTAVMGYIEAELPLIAALDLDKGYGQTIERHAVVITGYRCDSNGELTELYVHDDQIGPYSRVKPDGSFKKWKNEWSDWGYEVILDKLLIPIYPKIRLTFFRMYEEYKAVRKKSSALPEPPDDIKLHFTTIRKYKKFLIENSLREKEKVLTASLPRFIWIIRSYYENQPKEDVIYDGTSVYPTVLPYRIEFI